MSQKNAPLIWMNVTTSANWNRPPVGIVRVEQALCKELEAMYGKHRFRKCVWREGQFIEWTEPAVGRTAEIDDAVDMMLPRTESFDLSRRFLYRALDLFGKQSPARDGAQNVRLDVPVGDQHTGSRPRRETSSYRSVSTGISRIRPSSTTCARRRASM